MDKLTLARPYAKAAFAYALDTNNLKIWQQCFATLGELTKQKDISAYLLNPLKTKQEKIGFVLDAYVDLSDKKLDQAFIRLVHVLADKDKLHVLTEIAALYKRHYQSHTNQLEVKIYTPRLLNEQAKQSITRALAQRYHKDISISLIKDQSLIAGVVIETDIERIDASLKNRIHTMLKHIQL